LGVDQRGGSGGGSSGGNSTFVGQVGGGGSFDADTNHVLVGGENTGNGLVTIDLIMLAKRQAAVGRFGIKIAW
jgi:hypothetical protein